MSPSPNSKIVVASDFNVHNCSWLSHSSHTTPEGQYVELFAAHIQLEQIVREPTHIPRVEGQQQNTLDLFLTSHPDKYKVSILAPFGNSDHNTISASFWFSSLQSATRSATKRTVFTYENARWEELNEFLKRFNWNLWFLDNNVNNAAKMVENILLLGMNYFIPTNRVSIRPSDKCWFNQTCKLAIISREKAFSNWKEHKNPTTDLLRKQARSRCAKVLRCEKTLDE